MRFSTVAYAALTLTSGVLAANHPITPSRLRASTAPRAVPPPASAAVPARGRAGTGIPFGLFGINGRQLTDPYTAAAQTAQPEGILKDLAAARARGAHLFVNFAGGNRNYVDGEGHFDYESWKSRVDRFLPIKDQLNGYVADGTLLAFRLIDEPHVAKRWGGKAVPPATLDQMGQYSKSLFPDLLTVVGSAPTELRGGRPWRYLDVAWAQYAARKGPAAAFAATEASEARAQSLGLVVGLNISKGGDGSSGVGQPKEWSMSGKEILQYGHALLAERYDCAFISWDYRPSVVGRPDVADALRELADASRQHVETSCRQRDDRAFGRGP
jgi:hypothetical protein